MKSFSNLQDACNFINQKVLNYTQKLEQSYSRCSEGYAWCMNAAAVVSMLNPYDPADQYAEQAIRNFITEGYLEPLRSGGLKITPLGNQSIGKW